MRFFYTLILYLISPFLILRLMWKGRALPAYRARIKERFSLNKHGGKPVAVWLHAVSLGEVVAATPLVEHFLQNNTRVLITTMTPTGSAQVLKQFGKRVLHQYIPYDYPWALRRFFRSYKPRIAIIMETELWPNLIAEASSAGVDLFLVNARISGRAFKQYQWIKHFLKPALNQFKMIFTQSKLDSERFIALGSLSSQVKMMGNIKFDLSFEFAEDNRFSVFKDTWGITRPVIIAASTHDGEEQMVFEALKRIKVSIPDIILLIAPRHPERFQTVYQLSMSHGYKTQTRTQSEGLNESTEVLIIDSLGELCLFYALSDYAFVGGSFIPVGGHNVLEPIALGIPVFCGPYMQNSQAICDRLKEVGAITQVDSVDAFVNALNKMHNAPNVADAQVAQALSVLEENKGVVLRLYTEIKKLSP